MEQEIGTERAVIATVRSAWSAWLAAKEVIGLNQTAVDAAALSLEGVRAENTVGNRTILNILDAEQELLNAQVQLVTAKRNEYVAGFALLSAMGRPRPRTWGWTAGCFTIRCPTMNGCTTASGTGTATPRRWPAQPPRLTRPRRMRQSPTSRCPDQSGRIGCARNMGVKHASGR
jgi:hypothetical protein